MKIAVTDAAGHVDNAVVRELVGRGHEVTAFARSTDKMFQTQNIAAVSVDVNTADLADKLTGFDTVVSAFNLGWNDPNISADFTRDASSIAKAAKTAQVPYLLVVGGAGSLYAAPDSQVAGIPDLPKAIYDGVSTTHRLLTALLLCRDVNWPFVSLPVRLGTDGGFGKDKIGRYHLGRGDLLVGGKIPAGISAADLAVAIANDAEHKAYLSERFTVAAA